MIAFSEMRVDWADRTTRSKKIIRRDTSKIVVNEVGCHWSSD